MEYKNTEHVIIDSSLKSIFRVMIPVVISTFSVNLMYIIDRLMLAGYSIDAMNASVMSGGFVLSLTFFFVGVASASEVYVGQCNGRSQYSILAVPVWQMIYLGLFSNIIFIPIGFFSDYINILPSYYLQYGIEYQKPLFYFGSLSTLISAISAFFVGQGKTAIITKVAISGNIFNVIFDYLLIYNYHMGCKGAAIATVLSQVFQLIILFLIFFNKHNRETYKTLESYKFNLPVLKSCFKIGLPISINNFLTFIFWNLLYIIVAFTSKDIATIYGICTNIYIFLFFVADGLNKSISTIAANLIGQRDLESIKKTYKTFAIIILIFGVLTTIPLVFYPEIIFSLLDQLPDKLQNLYSETRVVLRLLLVGIVIEGLLQTVLGILQAGGDTKYPTIINQILLLVIILIPTLIMSFFNKLNSVVDVYYLIVLWGIVGFIIMHLRYKKMTWYNHLY